MYLPLIGALVGPPIGSTLAQPVAGRPQPIREGDLGARFLPWVAPCRG